MNDVLITALLGGIFVSALLSMQTLIGIKYELKKQTLVMEIFNFGKIMSEPKKEE